jgi:hypothetical protein
MSKFANRIGIVAIAATVVFATSAPSAMAQSVLSVNTSTTPNNGSAAAYPLQATVPVGNNGYVAAGVGPSIAAVAVGNHANGQTNQINAVTTLPSDICGLAGPEIESFCTQ